MNRQIMQATLAAGALLLALNLPSPPEGHPDPGAGAGACPAASPADAARCELLSAVHLRAEAPPPPFHPSRRLRLRALSAVIVDETDGRTLFAKNAEAVRPIASITKLMTAMVVLDSQLPMDEVITIERTDVDTLRHSRSRLRPGMRFTRADLLRMALMSSENRAASALARMQPGGKPAFVAAMNRSARQLGMSDTHFADPTGLRLENVSTAHDLTILVRTAYRCYPFIRETTTSSTYQALRADTGRAIRFGNSNPLVSDPNWRIGLSKTGFLAEAGPCLVMQTTISDRPLVVVLLCAAGKYTRAADARRIRAWIESSEAS